MIHGGLFADARISASDGRNAVFDKLRSFSRHLAEEIHQGYEQPDLTRRILGIEAPTPVTMQHVVDFAVVLGPPGTGHSRASDPSWDLWIPRTHSILTAPLWGVGSGITTGILTGACFTVLNVPVQFGTQETILFGIVGGLTASVCHLFGDSLTMGGIFKLFPAQVLFTIILLGTLGLTTRILVWKYNTPTAHNTRKRGNFRRDYA
jgi:hypothetical protein